MRVEFQDVVRRRRMVRRVEPDRPVPAEVPDRVPHNPPPGPPHHPPREGGGLYLAEPLTLPWILRHLGPVRFETLLSRIENGDRITDPWFWAARGELSDGCQVLIELVQARRARGDELAALTPREQEVLRLLAEGCSNREIAEALYIAPRTASTHVGNILQKLGLTSRTAAVARALQRGLSTAGRENGVVEAN